MTLSKKNYRKYTGTSLSKFNSKLGIDAYIPGKELIQAVETARLLNRPLLIRGEPGSGKTRLAEAIAVELHGEKYRDFFFPWPIKSTTKASEGLYEFDHLGRLYDINIKKEKIDLENYIDYGPIGRAYLKLENSRDSQEPIILIDEIDKADIDFPNDLLWELEQKEFSIKEIRDSKNEPKKVQAPKDSSPFIVITSNDERELPDAFLRRCLFYFIKFPTDGILAEIIIEKLRGIELLNEEIEKRKDDLIKKFREIRGKLINSSSNSKPPSTSELLDWVQIVAFYLTQPEWELGGERMILSHKDGTIIQPEDILLKKKDDRTRLS